MDVLGQVLFFVVVENVESKEEKKQSSVTQLSYVCMISIRLQGNDFK